MVSNIILIAVGIIALAAVGMFGPRLFHNYQRKRATENTFAIQNIQTGMNLRPYNAGIADNVKLVQYPHNEWECLTWQMIRMKDDSYLLKNLYTHKTFQPVATPASGVALSQRALEANAHQYWEFIKISDGKYNIRLKDTELYLTPSNSEKNSPIVLMPIGKSENQSWKLLEQHPIM